MRVHLNAIHFQIAIFKTTKWQLEGYALPCPAVKMLVVRDFTKAHAPGWV